MVTKYLTQVLFLLRQKDYRTGIILVTNSVSSRYQKILHFRQD